MVTWKGARFGDSVGVEEHDVGRGKLHCGVVQFGSIEDAEQGSRATNGVDTLIAGGS
jgi:hypothetical protein